MDFSVKIEGLDKLAQSSDLIKARGKNEIEKALYVSGKRVEKTAKESIQDGEGKRGGRFYKRGNILHQASAPGEPPSTDTGRLVNSINTYLNRAAGGLEAFVTAGRGTVNYAYLLEFGTRLMAARPFMAPALEKNKAWILARLQAAMRKALSGK
ncbi:HK97-gp10 family putative phage morphogenesis protein [Zavarzinella formosa]|uniref:HK97-gp10 family putative phage morphogenesis protein n=1 Tax=Zavarzinella formosa TaxID=360055 RepID=UPI0002FBF8DF|nr:HK97-gp10 family putative phage morphogenesis protein [Zavarzinella formosa]